MSELKNIIRIYETQVEHGMREITLNKSMFEGLLNQAKRVGELEEEKRDLGNKWVSSETEIKRQIKQNQRYKKALEELYQSVEHARGKSIPVSAFAGSMIKARQALEGESE